MGAKRKSYTPGFRRDAARLVLDTGRTIAEVAREIGVGEQLLGRWVATERSRMEDPPGGLDLDERAELERLRVESAQLRMDREFLKKQRPASSRRTERRTRAGVRVDRGAEGRPRDRADVRPAQGVQLRVSRSGYYKWVARQAAGPSARQRRHEERLVRIRQFQAASARVNGAPRITADLREAGEVVSTKTVAKLMGAHEIRGVSPRPWVPVTTLPDQVGHTIPDRVRRRFDRGGLNLVWTSDITYLATGQGWLYLCAVRDGHCCRVIGYTFADSLHTEVVETALDRAVTFREGETQGVIFHADRGCQYTSAQLAETAEALGVRLSVGRTGVCWDNAQIESFWSTLKTEFYDRHQFATHTEAIHAVSSWIETVYNRRRRHSALGQISPVTFEHRTNTAALEAA